MHKSSKVVGLSMHARLGVVVGMLLAALLGSAGDSIAPPAQAQFFLGASRARSANNLKQIGLAMHNYHDSFGAFPPAASSSKQGKPLLSWRVLILPFVEQDRLYKQFKLDEPWDSPNNKKLLSQMPKLYADVRGKAGDTMTFYQVFHGKGAAFEGTTGLKIASFADGTSTTYLAAEGGTAVPWTKPADLNFIPNKDLPKLGGVFDGDFHALMGDGSVRFVRKGMAEKTLRAHITRNGGETISD